MSRILLSIFASLSIAVAARAADPEWQPVTTELLEAEKPGAFGLCGVAVDRATGAVFVNLSDLGIYRSADQGTTWKRQNATAIKGRTEWPGCLKFDPTGKTKRMLLAVVYGAPIGFSDDEGATWKMMNSKVSHVDWCVGDWAENGPTFVLTLKHEAAGLLLASNDGGQNFREVGKGYASAWVFDSTTAVVAEAKSKDKPNPNLLRTTDGGKTFKPVAEYAATALPQWHGSTLYWVVNGALIQSTDKGETWTKLSDLKDGRYGPIFGKDAKHLFVLTNAGIVESTDGGATWSKPLPVPKELKGVSAMTWFDYDPKGDTLYVMKMASELYRWKREAAKVADPVTHTFLATGGETFIADDSGKATWSYPHSSRDGWVLPNGNVLLALSTSKTYPHGAVVEVTKEGKTAFEFKGTQSEVNTVQPLGTGHFLLTEAGEKPRLLEVNAEGKVLVDLPLQAQTKDKHLQTRMARKLANGNYLVPQLLDRVVREYDPQGKVVWEVKTPHMPFTAIRLPDGNTLIGCTLGNLVIEVDSKGTEVWRVTNDDLPNKPINDACGVQRLPNGNTVITSHHAGANQVKLTEITREKKIVWTHTDTRRAGIHHFQILSTNGKDLPGIAMK